jgi:hypothetical protein
MSINRLIAESRGWHSYSEMEYLGRFDFDEALINPDSGEYEHIPDYEGDLNAAIELLKEIHYSTVWFETSDMKWRVRYMAEKDYPRGKCVFYIHKSLAYAICIAWLDFKGIEIPQEAK